MTITNPVADVRLTPEEAADAAFDRYVAEHGPVVTSPSFTELAARTLIAASRRAPATPDSSSAVRRGAAEEPGIGAAAALRGSGVASRSSKQKAADADTSTASQTAAGG